MSEPNGTAPSLSAQKARLAALNRLKAKQRLTGAADGAGPSTGSGPSSSRNGDTNYVNKAAAGPSTNRNAAADLQGDQAPLRRDPGLVSILPSGETG